MERSESIGLRNTEEIARQWPGVTQAVMSAMSDNHLFEELCESEEMCVSGCVRRVSVPEPAN